MSCEDLALPSNNLECGSQSDVFFGASDRQMDTGSPHLVSADEAMPESRQVVGRPLDAELIHPVPKRVGMEIQDSRRTLRPINHSICVLKGGQDMVSLHLFQRRQS